MTTSITRAQREYNFKVVLLGEGCVGKTSIVMRYVEDKFSTKHITTLQASFITKKLQLDNGTVIQLNIWDTAGQERFHALGPIYYRGSHGAILVYDITDQDSFQKVKNWIKELKRTLEANIILIIVGNKIDLHNERTVPYNVALTYAKSVGACYFETSAKTNENIDNVFKELAHLMAEQNAQCNQRNHWNGYFGPRRLIVEESFNGPEQSVPEPSRACCG